MTTGILSLNLTTLDNPGITCMKAMATERNVSSRTFSQIVGEKSSGSWRIKYLDYQPVRRRTQVRKFTSVDRQTGESLTHTFHYTIRGCAVIQKQSNKAGRAYREGWELWVNKANLVRKPEDETFCRMYYKLFCNCTKPKQYKIEDCDERHYKGIMLA
uniref:Putative 22.5 kDa secreted histamine binding protein n=1 Tax=Rhipicephalus sanguineus TaxID=34632 RepID=C9W1G2_RHISA